MYTHIVFDIDNTIINSTTAILLTLQKLLRDDLGIDKTIEELKFCVGFRSEGMLRHFDFPDIPEAKKKWEKLININFSHQRLYDGIIEVLSELKKRRIFLGVVTSRSSSELQDGCFPAIAHFFDLLVTEDMVKRYKPDPEPLYKYMELAGVKPFNVLYIGDTRYDSECAKAAGIDFALAVWGALTSEIPARYFLAHPVDILEMV